MLSRRLFFTKPGTSAAGPAATATGWRTDTMVYLELTRLGRPELAELVRQYYEPEFAFYSTADAELAIEKGKELIIKWE